MKLISISSSVYSEATTDYVGLADVHLYFGVGDLRVYNNIEVIHNNICESEQIKDFFVDLVYVRGEQPIVIDPERTRIVINSTAETECGKLCSYFMP